MKQRLEQRQSIEMQQRQIAELIQRADLLQTTLPELEAKLQDLEDTGIIVSDEDEEPAAAVLEAPPEPAAEAAPAEDLKVDIEAEDEFLPFHETAYGVSDPDEDPKADFIESQPDAGVTLREHLIEQLEDTDAPDRIKALAARLASSLDANGYLVSSAGAVAERSAAGDDMYQPPPLSGFPREPLEEVFMPTVKEAATGDYVMPTEAEQAAALALLQNLDPAGVGARSRQECLLLQARDMPDLPAAVRTIIEQHLEDLVNNRLPRIADALGASLEALKELLREFHRFDLFPGRRFHRHRLVYVRPEVVVRRDGDDYAVQVLIGGRGRMRLNREMLRLARRARGEAKDFLARRFQDARRLLEHLEQRRLTLERIANVLVGKQRAFLENGEAFLKPLEMQQVAGELGMDVSTVSRAVSGKYVDTPVGVFPLRMLFSSGFRRSGHAADDRPEALSRLAIKNLIAEIVQREDKSHPLADDEIAAELARRGVNIKRRTVNKYRAEIGIPSKEKRSQY